MLKAKNKLGLIFFPAFDWAISPYHPEREERLLYTMDQVKEEGVGDIEGIEFYNPLVAKDIDIQRVHFMVPSVEERLTESHLIAAGGAIKAFDLVMKGQVDKSFALTRPPGHHAQRLVYGDRGFCISNMEAIGLESARARYGNFKAAVVDTDCHHGDGTEDIYWNDPYTLFISFHQDGRTLYPGTGFIDDLGGPGGYGYNVNIPLPPNTRDQGFLYALDNAIMPILKDYGADLIINSAGQDNHYSDPITNMKFSAQGYGKLNERLNPDIAVLEGGYSIEAALPYVNLGIILAMAGLDYSGVREPDYRSEETMDSKENMEYIKVICEEVMKSWENKEKLREDYIRGRDYIVEKKDIFYDTDNIMERQKRTFKVCEHCSGYFYIDSHASNKNRAFCIVIPLDACESCYDQGYRLFEKTEKSSKNQYIYLQDRIKDLYLTK